MTALFLDLIEWFFGCPHRTITFPLTRMVRGIRRETYVTCVECGKEFSYDWQRMRLGKQIKPEPVSLLEEEA